MSLPVLLWDGWGSPVWGCALVFLGMEPVLFAIQCTACCRFDCGTCWCSFPGLTPLCERNRRKRRLNLPGPRFTTGIFQPLTSPGMHEQVWGQGTYCNFTISTQAGGDVPHALFCSGSDFLPAEYQQCSNRQGVQDAETGDIFISISSCMSWSPLDISQPKSHICKHRAL